jgi:hypothetical protein
MSLTSKRSHESTRWEILPVLALALSVAGCGVVGSD